MTLFIKGPNYTSMDTEKALTHTRVQLTDLRFKLIISNYYAMKVGSLN